MIKTCVCVCVWKVAGSYVIMRHSSNKLTFFCKYQEGGTRKFDHRVTLFHPRSAIASGLHGYNGMLVGLLMAVFSKKFDYYWWLLFPVTFTAMAW